MVFHICSILSHVFGEDLRFGVQFLSDVQLLLGWKDLDNLTKVFVR